jgi:uncharacterized delta-60 repeat protein
MSVVKFDGNGTLDGSFGTGGSTEISNFFTSSQDRANAIQVQTDGKIILGGTSTNNNLPYQQRCFVLARLDSTGILDPTYGSGGVVITDLSPSYNLEGRTMVIQPDDKIVLGGTWDILGTAPASFALARYDTTGALDTTFGLAGTGLILEDIDPTVNPSGSGHAEEGYSLAIQPDGKILMGGYLNTNLSENGPQSFILARYFGFPPFPPTPTPIVSICFPAGTPVLTDQGNIPIEKLEPKFHTIHQKPIIAITQTIMNENKIVCIEKHSLGINIPNRKTYISNYHGILYKNKLIPAKQLVGKLRGIYYINYNGDKLYNILMEKHYIISINNMKVETLNPKNIIAKLYTSNYDEEEKTKIILEINENSKNNINNISINNISINNHNNFEKMTNNRTVRKLSIFRFNPNISKLNFHTKRHSMQQHNYTNRHNRISFLRNNAMSKINMHTFKHNRRRR